MTDQTRERSPDERQRAVLERARRNTALTAQDQASLASFERGDPTTPGPQVVREAEERTRRA